MTVSIRVALSSIIGKNVVWQTSKALGGREIHLTVRDFILHRNALVLVEIIVRDALATLKTTSILITVANDHGSGDLGALHDCRIKVIPLVA